MARDFEVQFLETHVTQFKAPLVGVYAIRPDRPMVWLQKLCARVLDKLGAVYLDDRQTVERRRISPCGVMEAVYRQRSDLFEFLGRGGETLLIGGEDYGRLMREAAINQYVEFGAEYRVGGPPKVMGLTVKVVPWMSGMIVLPN